MSDLSEKIKNKLDNRYGDNQQMTDNLIKSNGAWYNSGVEQAPANPILDTLGVFGGSLIGGTGDLITGLATDGRDFARKQWQAAHDANPDLFPDNEKPYDFGGIAVDLGRTLSDYGAKMTANHMRVGNAPNNQPWASTKLEDRIFNPDYWSDIANGPGTDLAMMAGSFVPQMALMAVTPETKIAEDIGEAINVAKVAKSASAMEKAVAKAKQFLGSDAAASMERWGIAGGPTTAYMNSGGIYGDLAKQGYNDDQIADAMRNMRYEELPQDFLTSSVAGLGVSGAMGRLAKGAGKIRQGVQNIALNMPLDAAAEYYDEANQQRIQNKYTNKPYGKDIFHLTDDEQAAGASAVVPSLLLGVAGGVRNALPKNSKWRKCYDKLTGNRYTPDNPANQPNSINTDTQTPDSTVATNVNDTVNAGYDTMVPAFEGANVNYTGTYGTPAVTTEAVTNAAAPFMGVRMDNGSNGCVEAVTKIGASTSSFLNNELSNGVVGVPTLVSDAEKAGVPVVAYSPDNVAAGDIIVYGDNDHVVMADGQGGYVGNSSSQQQVVHGSDLEAMGGISPTKIIKTGGNNGFTMASINEDDVFSGLDDFDIEDIFDLYSDSNVDEAGNKTEFPGYSELVDADTKKISKDNYGKAVNNEEFMKGLMDYVYSLIYDDNVNLARIASYNASKHGNLQELARINKMISENDTEGISEVANEVRSKLNTLATNYFTAIDKATQDYTSRLEKATGEKSVSAQVANTQQNEPVADVENATNLNSGENIPSTANEASMPEYVSNDDMDYSGLNEALNSLGIGLEDAQPMQTPQSTEQILNAQAPRSTASSQQMTQPAAPLMLEAPRQTGYPAQSPEQWMMQALGQQNTMQPPATGNTAMASQQEATQSNTEQVNVREMTEDEALNGPVADTVAQRKEQARVLRNIAQANDIELPKKLNAGLDSGAKKAVAAAQSHIKHELAKKAEADNNESESTSTKETKTTEGQHTEDKIQHTEPEQGNEEKRMK
ncbi:MAG: DUF1720 domain-containing protein [Selenomonadaceae bacterium]|nr:DUF1720 domain-containing protein [Selenomonadaceae bacterium]